MNPWSIPPGMCLCMPETLSHTREFMLTMRFMVHTYLYLRLQTTSINLTSRGMKT